MALWNNWKKAMLRLMVFQASIIPIRLILRKNVPWQANLRSKTAKF